MKWLFSLLRALVSRLITMSRAHPVARGKAAANTGLNNAPVWTTVPTVTFTRGVTVAEDLTPYVTDPDVGQTVTISLLSGSLPSGVTLSGNAYNYNGTAAGATATGIILRATDNGTSPLAADSNAHSVIISDVPAWTSVPTAAFTELVAGQVNLGAYVSNYSAATDVFSVNPAFTQIGPSSSYPWLTLTGTGGVLLTADGTQVDADDLPASPGLNIGVSRSGGPIVYSGAFAVTVTAAPVVLGTLTDFAYEGRRALPAPWIDPQTGGSGSLIYGKHANFQFSPDDDRIYIYGSDGQYVGTGNDSGVVRLARLAFSAAPALALTYDHPYPWWGIAGTPFPAGQDCCPFIYDSTRGCFWIAGGFYQSGSDARNIGTNQRYGIWRYWTRASAGALQYKYEQVAAYPGTGAPAPPANAHGEGMGGSYIPSLDCLVWVGSNVKNLFWYNCATGATGQCSTGAYAESVQKYPGVAVGAEGASVQESTTVYDSVNNEFIWQCWASNTANDFKGVYATSLDNFPGSLTTRQLYRDGTADISSIFGQQPAWIRGRKYYCSHQPYGYSNTGFGLGFLEIDLDDPDPVSTARAAAHPYFEPTNTATGTFYNQLGVIYPNRNINSGGYDEANDMFVATQTDSSYVNLYRWQPPTWTPQTSGTVTGITTNSQGATSASFASVVPSGAAYAKLGTGRSAWRGGCLARDLSTNGAMLYMGGGDADYFGNEVYAYDWDSRNWFRLSEPCLSLTGGAARSSNDAALPTSDSFYFNTAKCEHGPLVADYGWGLLPIDGGGVQQTQPGVPHLYGSQQWIPGSFIGNKRGALVLPVAQFVYGPTAATYQAHYFDLDVRRWGRLSDNGGVYSHAFVPTTAVDEEAGRIYHNMGYLDLNAKHQELFTWQNFPFVDCASDFDPIGRLWVIPGDSGALRAVNVDNPARTFQSLTVVGADPWAGMMWGGLCYSADEDCFFFYVQKYVGGVSNVQNIWRIDPPSSGSRLTGTWTRTKIVMTGSIAGDLGAQSYNTTRWVRPLKGVSIFNNTAAHYLYKP